MSDRCRAWCFTINNYTEEEYQFLKNVQCVYIVFQKEVGALLTPHIQGYVYLKDKISMSRVKVLLGCDRVHLERAIGSAQQNYDYCTKDGGTDQFEAGEMKQPVVDLGIFSGIILPSNYICSVIDKEYPMFGKCELTPRQDCLYGDVDVLSMFYELT